jgi:rod shape-determining protein MreC
VHDKTVRRRRAVLALLVVISLILITASFGGSGGGALHTVQSGFLDVLSPVETVASKALTPVHDLISAVDDVFHASSQRNQLRRELAAANKQIATLEGSKHASSDARKLHHLDSTLALEPDGPVNATVIKQPESVFVSNVTIDAGLGAGVHVNDPVIDPDGVIGIVTTAAADSAVVTLINDPSSGVTARDAMTREIGVVAQKPGSPGELQLQYVSEPNQVKVGDLIVTAGLQDTHDASFFPAGLPIGVVKNATTTVGGVITVSPAADLSSLGTVQVLTAVPRP